MKIQDLLRKDVMLLDLQATKKTAVIDEMIKSLTEHGYVTDFETFKEGILAREALTSTGSVSYTHLTLPTNREV